MLVNILSLLSGIVNDEFDCKTGNLSSDHEDSDLKPISSH